MSGRRQLSFEIYYLNSGRWQIHARYGAQERELSIEEAKRLDKEPHIEAVCVVRESFDPETASSTEAVIYHTPTMKSKPPVSTITSGAGAAGGGKKATAKLATEALPADSAAGKAQRAKQERAKAQKDEKEMPPLAEPVKGQKKKGKKSKQAENIADLIPSLAWAFFISTTGGLLCGAIAFLALQVLADLNVVLGRTLNLILLVGAFISTFGLLFIPRVKRILRQMRSIGFEAAAAEDGGSGGARAQASRAPASFDWGSIEKPTLTEKEQAKLDAQEDQKVKELLPVAGETKAATDDIRKHIDAFFTEIIGDASKSPSIRLNDNSYMQFGMMLFLAGAGEPKIVTGEWERNEMLQALHTSMNKIGMDTSQSAGFAANIEEYLLKPEYLQMYDRGRKAGMRRLNDPKSDNQVVLAFSEWLRPKPKEQEASKEDAATQETKDDKSVTDADKKAAEGQENASQGEKRKPKDSVSVAEQTVKQKRDDEKMRKFVAVMFTDIVDSTQNQQEKGDVWLMNVVRAHNEIVREAIAVHGGREIKHTGDGIMATFTGVFQSVDAAMAMQKGFRKFNRAVPEYAFEVRAGLSAGEPIHEGGDIFGTPVNLAARVMSKAGPEQVAVSAIVREMCRGKGIPFQNLGQFELKGFTEAQPIYLIDLVKAKVDA